MKREGDPPEAVVVGRILAVTKAAKEATEAAAMASAKADKDLSQKCEVVLVVVLVDHTLEEEEVEVGVLAATEVAKVVAEAEVDLGVAESKCQSTSKRLLKNQEGKQSLTHGRRAKYLIQIIALSTLDLMHLW